jgi:2-dehydro-3-deoxy-D-gluconate 5-dehydrogenase
MFDLTGRVAVVTGGNGGIGLGMAKGLAAAGASIVVAARNPEKSAAALPAIEALGVEAIAVTTDVADKMSVDGTVATTLDRFGRVDILVNNAGVDAGGGAADITAEEWALVLDVNITGAHHCCQAVYPAMCEAGGGKIINIGSMMSLFGHGFAPAYAASKGAIVQYTKALACGWASDNIQVNSVLPGWIDTELTRGLRNAVPEIEGLVVGRTPAGRWGEPGDLAGVAVFLASSASDFVTGTAIPVDGGYAAQG